MGNYAKSVNLNLDKANDKINSVNGNSEVDSETITENVLGTHGTAKGTSHKVKT